MRFYKGFGYFTKDRWVLTRKVRLCFKRRSSRFFDEWVPNTPAGCAERTAAGFQATNSMIGRLHGSMLVGRFMLGWAGWAAGPDRAADGISWICNAFDRISFDFMLAPLAIYPCPDRKLCLIVSACWMEGLAGLGWLGWPPGWAGWDGWLGWTGCAGRGISFMTSFICKVFDRISDFIHFIISRG